MAECCMQMALVETIPTVRPSVPFVVAAPLPSHLSRTQQFSLASLGNSTRVGVRVQLAGPTTATYSKN